MSAKMGFFSTVLGFFGFGTGLSIGVVVGYYLFIYFQPTDVKVRSCRYSFFGYFLNYYFCKVMELKGEKVYSC